MLTVLLVTQIIVAIVLVVVVLMQRSEGGALGIGGGGGGAGGGLMSGRGVAGALVRTTIIFGAIFFATSLALTTLATKNDTGGITEIEETLDENFGGQSIDDALGTDGLGDLRDPDLTLSDDPLAQPVLTPPATGETAPDAGDEAAEDEIDPLADPLADPQ